MQLKVRQAEKHLCKDTLRSEKTGILYGIKAHYDKQINKNSFVLLFCVPHIPVRWRFRSKRKVGASSCSSLDIYLNHQMGNQAPNEHSGRSGVCSPTPIRQPSMPNSSGSLENNIVKSGNLSAVMDDKGSILCDIAFSLALINIQTYFLSSL